MDKMLSEMTSYQISEWAIYFKIKKDESESKQQGQSMAASVKQRARGK